MCFLRAVTSCIRSGLPAKANSGIAPGELTSGFEVVGLPFFPQAQKTEFIKTRVWAIALRELSFRAHFSDGICVWGHVDPVSPETRKK
jgi:hypothetical protein